MSTAKQTPGSKRPSSVDGGMETFPMPFGNYILLQAFARGGMGEVYLAKRGAILGAEKYCVLKKLRPELTRDREYVARFIDEARIVVQLSHANICQVFDVGRVGSEYYLAMEYVSGRDARSLQDRAREQDLALNEASVLQLMTETLAALDYAHRRTHSVTGETLNLVHRDVSPQNVMVSFEGEVKLIDFGLASSRLKVERTQPNIVMGKMAYMAPEQARGDAIDARADLFAAAVILYELLAGERFYEGMSSNDIWMVVGRGGYVPKRWDTLSPELAPIIGRALHPDVKQRFATCADFREALTRYLHTHHPGQGERALRELIHVVFEDEIARERERLAGFGDVSGEVPRDVAEMTRSQSVSLAHAEYLDDPTTGESAGSARIVHDERTRLQPDDLPTQSVNASMGRDLPTEIPSEEDLTTGSGDHISEEMTLLEQAVPTQRTQARDGSPKRSHTPPTGQAIPALGPAEPTEAVPRARVGAEIAPTVVLAPELEPARGSAARYLFALVALVALGVGVAWFGLRIAGERDGDELAAAPGETIAPPTEPSPPLEPTGAGDITPPTEDPASEPDAIPPTDQPTVAAAGSDVEGAPGADTPPGDTPPGDTPANDALANDDPVEASAEPAGDSDDAAKRASAAERLRRRIADKVDEGRSELAKKGYKSESQWTNTLRKQYERTQRRPSERTARYAAQFAAAARKAPPYAAKEARPTERVESTPTETPPPEAPKPKGLAYLRSQLNSIKDKCASPVPPQCDFFKLVQGYNATKDDGEKIRIEKQAARCAVRCD